MNLAWLQRLWMLVRGDSRGRGHPADRLELEDSPEVAELAEVAEVSEVVELEIETCLDLHEFSPRDTRVVVEAYLEAAVERGFAEVRIVHGRGRGVQRRIVQSLLAAHPGVARYRDAGAERGGWGATIVTLARTIEDDPPRSGP